MSPGDPGALVPRTSENEGAIPRPASVAEVIEPTFIDLSDKRLLSKCMMGLTQNNNEALHSVMWIIAPKHLHHIPNVMLFAADLAIGRFNDGRNEKTIAAGEVPLFECTAELQDSTAQSIMPQAMP